MKCSQTQKRLPIFSGGDLPMPEAGEIADHLRECPQCQRVADDYAQDRQTLRRVADRTAPAGDWEACWRAVEGRLGQAADRAPIVAFPSWVRSPGVLKAAAAFLLALGVGVLVGVSMGRPAARQNVAKSDPDHAVDVALPTAPPSDGDHTFAQASRNPAYELLTIGELGVTGAAVTGTASPRTTYHVAPVVAPRTGRGYYMDNVQLIGNR